MIREAWAAVRYSFMASSSLPHSGCCSQCLVEPTENPSMTSNHLPNCSLVWNHFRRSLASFWFFEYFMTMCENGMWYPQVPAGPRGIAKWSMSRHIGSPLSARVLLLPAVGGDVDGRAVERGADLAGQERAVVVGVVPGEAAFVAGVLPERRHPLDRLDGLLAVQARPALLVRLGPAEVPHQRVCPRRRVAEGVAERLADRVSLLLQLHAELAILVQRLGRRRGPGGGEPRLAVGDHQTADRPRDRQVALAVLDGLLGLPVVPALVLV